MSVLLDSNSANQASCLDLKSESRPVLEQVVDFPMYVGMGLCAKDSRGGSTIVRKPGASSLVCLRLQLARELECTPLVSVCLHSTESSAVV